MPKDKTPKNQQKNRKFGKVSRRHPLFGCMEGLLHIPDDTDVTAPADPEWGEVWTKERNS